MKRNILALILSFAMLLALSACGSGQDAQIVSADEETPPAAPAGTDAPAAEPTPIPEPARQDGERFEGVTVVDGMEETVFYEHLRSEGVGIEMDYDYVNFLRQSTADRERFVSVWDDAAAPENYLDVMRSTEDAETAAEAVSQTLSQDYEISRGTMDLNRGGSCIYIGASEVKGGGYTADQMQMVFIVPAAEGSRICWVHHGYDSADAFGRRFADMVRSVSVLDGAAAGPISEEQALSGIRAYCCSVNPDLEEIVNEGEYPAYWELESADEAQIVVLFRSYTGALIRYYIDRATGETYETEFVPGVTAEETRTDLRFDLRSYLG